jgi:hypothetical protein
MVAHSDSPLGIGDTPITPSGHPLQDFCTMLGLMTFTWAWAENTLAMIVGIIIEQTGPITGHRAAPLSLKGKIACFRNALRDVVALKPCQQEGRALAERFVQLGPRRHQFVHAAAWELGKGSFQGISISVIAEQYAVKNHRVNIGDAVTLNAEITKLKDDAAAFLMKVHGILTSRTPTP